jgi:hypothetical protein
VIKQDQPAPWFYRFLAKFVKAFNWPFGQSKVLVNLAYNFFLNPFVREMLLKPDLSGTSVD